MFSCHDLYLRYKKFLLIPCALLSFYCHILISLLKQLLMSEQVNAPQAFGMIESHKICYLKKMILFLLCRWSGVIQRSSGGTDEPAWLSCVCQRLCLRWSCHPQVTSLHPVPFLLTLYPSIFALLVLFPLPPCCTVAVVKAQRQTMACRS